MHRMAYIRQVVGKCDLASLTVAAIGLPKRASVRAQEEIQIGSPASPMPWGDK
jgi:hypothetical protein